MSIAPAKDSGQPTAQASEADCLLAIEIATLIGFELLPWQERLLQRMLADHRQRPAGEKA